MNKIQDIRYRFAKVIISSTRVGSGKIIYDHF